MEQVILEAESRDVSTKQQLKTLRQQGKVPAVFYGVGEKSMSLVIDGKKFDKLVHGGKGGNVLIELKINNESKTAVIKEIQRDIIKQNPIHIDFLAVSLKEKIEVNVPLRIVGEAPGVKLSGGVMEHLLREVRVSCLPTVIPAFIGIDVSHLDINHSFAVKDLPKMEGVEIVTDLNSIIINIVAPTELEEPAAAGEAAVTGVTGAEPEVISKGKKEKEDGAAATETKKSESPKPGAPKPGDKK